jgi:hypothetical protein
VGSEVANKNEHAYIDVLLQLDRQAIQYLLRLTNMLDGYFVDKHLIDRHLIGGCLIDGYLID